MQMLSILSYTSHYRVRGLYFLAVIFVATIDALKACLVTLLAEPSLSSLCASKRGLPSLSSLCAFKRGLPCLSGV